MPATRTSREHRTGPDGQPFTPSTAVGASVCGTANSARTIALTATIGFLALVLMALIRPIPPVYDEAPYLELARQLKDASSIRGWLIGNELGATGPWHSIVHYAASGMKGVLPTPWFRAVNLVLLPAILLSCAWALRSVGEPGWKAWLMLGVPMTWPLAGMALTEIPAMIGVAVAVLAALKLGRPETAGRTFGPWLLLVLGAAIGFLGRQTYVVLLPTLGLLAWSGSNLRSVTSALGLSIVPVGMLFAIWGGTLPPKVAPVAGGGLVTAHALAAVGYLGVTVALVAPGFFWANRSWVVPSALIAGLANQLGEFVEFSTLTGVKKMLPFASWGGLIDAFSGLIFAGCGAGVLAALAAECVRARERRFVAFTLGVLGLCGVCALIPHQFSSRYVGMALPLLIPMLAPWIRPNRFAQARLLAGMLLGAAILESYYRSRGYAWR